MLDVPYWLTEDFCREHGRKGAAQLGREFPDCAHWNSRRMAMHRAFPELVPMLDRLSNPIGEYEDAPDVVAAPLPGEFTTAEKVERDREVRRLTERAKEAEAKYAEAMRGGEVEDRIVDAMEKRVPRLAPVHAPTFAKRSGGKPETAVALVSDYHIGEVVSIEETGGLAHYDFDTFTRRWQYHVDSIGGIVFGKLTGYDIPRLRIAMLGDMVSGIIHEELVDTAEGTVMEWVIDGAHVVAQGIRQLAAEFAHIDVDCVVGYHGRMSKQVRFKQRYVNWDYLFYHFVRLELADQHNVAFTIPKSFYMLAEVEGHGILLLHGDNIKSWNGVPWYGINRAVTNLSALLHAQKRTFSMVNLGHFHNAGTLDRIDSELILNGSAIGGNEFSIGALFTSNQPRQVLYGMHPEHGRTWQYSLDLSVGDAKPCRYTT